MEKPDISRSAPINCVNCGAVIAANSPTCAYCDSPLHTCICTVCFSAVSKGMNHCPKCGAQVKKSPGASSKSLNCPVCRNSLDFYDDDSQPLYACPQCGGMWLDHNSFQFICDRVERQALEQGYKLPNANVSPVQKNRRAYIPCPECGIIMTPTHFARCSGIIIDSCRVHGNWFDWQELHRVLAFIQNGGMSKSRKLEISRAREDARMDRHIGSAMKKFAAEPDIRMRIR